MRHQNFPILEAGLCLPGHQAVPLSPMVALQPMGRAWPYASALAPQHSHIGHSAGGTRASLAPRASGTALCITLDVEI